MPKTSTAGTTRPRRSPAERAQADLDKANKGVEKATLRLDAARTTLAEAEAEHQRAVRYQKFASMNPDLPEQETVDVEAAVPMEAAPERVSV